MSSKNKVLIIDGDNLCHRAYHKFAQLTTREGESTALPFGFFYILNSLVRRFAPNRVFISFDGGSSSIRREVLPEYKVRERKDTFDGETFYRQKQEIIEQCQLLNIHVFWGAGFEADDLIYMILKKFVRDEYVTIVSSDKDFIQLLEGTTTIFNPASNKTITEASFEKDWGITPRQHLDYLILDGDKSDKIPGCKGMGDVRIKRFLEEWESIEEYLEEGGDPDWDKYDIKETYERNNILINLRLFYSKYLRKKNPPRLKRLEFNPDKVTSWSRKYEITKVSFEQYERLG